VVCWCDSQAGKPKVTATMIAAVVLMTTRLRAGERKHWNKRMPPPYSNCARFT
jgi:hypothetical protein